MVLWHGLGDSHSSPGILEFISKVKQVHPGIFVHSVYVEEDLSEDQKAGTVRSLLYRIDLTMTTVCSTGISMSR